MEVMQGAHDSIGAALGDTSDKRMHEFRLECGRWQQAVYDPTVSDTMLKAGYSALVQFVPYLSSTADVAEARKWLNTLWFDHYGKIRRN